MAENTKKKKAPGKKPGTKPKTSSRAPSKAKKKQEREDRMKGTLFFGVKLVIVLALVAGVSHAYLYGKGIYDNNQNKEAAVNASGDFSPESTLPDDEGNYEVPAGQDAGQTGAVKDSDGEKGRGSSEGTSGKKSDKNTDSPSGEETGEEPVSSETVPVKVDALGDETGTKPSEVHISPDVEIDPEVPTVPAVLTESPQNQGGNLQAQGGISSARDGDTQVQSGISQAQDGNTQAQGGISQAQNRNAQAQGGISQTQNGLPQVQNGAPQAGTTELAVQAPALQSIPSPGLVDPSKPMIAFTFDDGPYTKVDKRILDVLEAHGGRATFFIVGSRVEDYKETLKRIYNSGSEIGNHTFNHKNLEKITPEEVVSQVEMTNDAVEAVTGFRPKLVRVPYGAYQGQVTGLVNYPLIQWNVDTEDWKNKDKASALDSILSHAKDGNIILMHDLYPSTAEAFEEAVPLLAAQGFQLVTVSEMYAAKGIEMEAGKVYFNVK